MFAFKRTVRFKAANNLFYRRIRHVDSLESVTLRGVPTYKVTKQNGSITFIPVTGTSIMAGKDVTVKLVDAG